MVFFPHPLTSDENGILGIEGNLDPDTLLLAYHFGIFPWYGENDPIIWWYPKERFVLFPNDVYVSKSMAKIFKNRVFRITVNQAFSEVMEHCAFSPRKGQAGTWLNQEMRKAYNKLFLAGYGLSVEVWKDGVLAGGLYGVSIGKFFFGESMFSLLPDTSKAAFIYLALLLDNHEFKLIDCQQENPHIRGLNARYISETLFFHLLYENRRIHMYEKRTDWKLPSEEAIAERVSRQRAKSIA